MFGSGGRRRGQPVRHEIVRKIIDLTGNKVGTRDDFQDLLITWEIKAFLVLLGAVFAGASTKNGLKQGLVVGIVASSSSSGSRHR